MVKSIGIAVLVILSFGRSNGQATYNLTIDSIAYQARVNGERIYQGTSWSHAYSEQVYLGFDFPFLDTLVNSINIEASGRIVFDANHHYWADLHTIAWLRSAINPDSSLVEIFRETTFDGKKTLIIQFSKARYVSDVNKKTSFQLSLREGDSAISFHQGPKDDVQGTNDISLGPYLAYAKAGNLNNLQIINGRFWYSTPGGLADTIIRNSAGINFLGYEISKHWSENILLTLIPKTQSLADNYSKTSNSYYSHPTKTLHLNEKVDCLEIHDMQGKRHYQIKHPCNKLDLHFLPEGVYTITLKRGKKHTNLKIVVK